MVMAMKLFVQNPAYFLKTQGASDLEWQKTSVYA